MKWFKKGLEAKDGGDFWSLRTMAQNTSSTDFIDVLKVDCEGCEFNVFQDKDSLEFIKTTVAQLLIEVHIGYGTVEKTAAIAQNILDAGALARRGGCCCALFPAHIPSPAGQRGDAMHCVARASACLAAHLIAKAEKISISDASIVCTAWRLLLLTLPNRTQVSGFSARSRTCWRVPARTRSRSPF